MAYAAYRFVPHVPDEICTLIGCDVLPDHDARLRLLLDGYGTFAPDEVLDAIEHRIKAIIDTGLARHAAGDIDDLPMRGARPDVIKPWVERDLRFVRAQRR